jgi:hypothetical protein
MTRKEAITEAKSLAKLHGFGYAMQKPGQPWEAVRSVPSIRFNTKVVECDAEGREFKA